MKSVVRNFFIGSSAIACLASAQLASSPVSSCAARPVFAPAANGSAAMRSSGRRAPSQT